MCVSSLRDWGRQHWEFVRAAADVTELYSVMFSVALQRETYSPRWGRMHENKIKNLGWTAEKPLLEILYKCGTRKFLNQLWKTNIRYLIQAALSVKFLWQAQIRVTMFNGNYCYQNIPTKVRVRAGLSDPVNCKIHWGPTHINKLNFDKTLGWQRLMGGKFQPLDFDLFVSS